MKPERILRLAGAENFRELGGYKNIHNQTIKWQKILRSGELSRLTPQAVTDLKAYGLLYDIDLRSPAEVQWNPDRIPDGTIFRSYPAYPVDKDEPSDLPVNYQFKFQPSHLACQPYKLMLFDNHSRLAFRAMFIDLLTNTNDKQSLLFHCAAGKDRTGIAALLVLSALEVPYDTIRQDYLLTNLIYSHRDQDELRSQLTNQHAADFINEMNSVFQVAGQNLDQAQDLVLQRFGSWHQYFIEALELTDSALTDLQKIYLE